MRNSPRSRPAATRHPTVAQLARGQTTPLNPWRGHFPITSLALVAILNRESTGTMDFSRTERVLYVACEFWAAVQARELATHLGLDLDASDPLEPARIAFSVIGLPRIAAALQHDGRQRFADLAEELVRIPEPVDLAIARYARRYLREELGVTNLDVSSATDLVDDDRLLA